jgi:ATP synthase protein I
LSNFSKDKPVALDELQTEVSRETETFDQPVVLTDEDRARINARARRELMQLVVAQGAAGVVVALLAWLIAGELAGLSALAGAAAYFVPNLLFALRLFVATFSSKGSGPAVFLLGEMLKVAAVIGLLWLIADVGGEQVQWFAVLAGLVAVLKGYLLMLALRGTRAR